MSWLLWVSWYTDRLWGEGGYRATDLAWVEKGTRNKVVLSRVFLFFPVISRYFIFTMGHNISFWPILPIYKLQVLSQQLRAHITSCLKSE